MRLKIFIAGCLVNLFSCGGALSQTFTSGASGMSILAGTPMFIDSLVLTPSADVTFTSNSLTRSTTAVSVNGVSGILNQFTFASPITFGGTATLGYTPSQLNGNSASELVVAYNSASAGSYTLNCTSTTDTINGNVTSSALSGVNLYNISAVKSTVSVAAIAGASSLNVGTTILLADTTSGGTWSSYNTAVATVNTAGLVSGISGGVDTIAYTVSNTCNSASAIKVLNVNARSSWIGVTSIDWSDNSNWSTGVVPTSMVSASIPAGTPYSPTVISGSYDTKDIDLASGTVVTLNAATGLHVKGNITNNGSLAGPGTLSLDTSVLQTVSGIGNVRNLLLNNAAGASIASGARMMIDSLVTITSGALTTGDSLVLNSDALVTARVAALPASGAAISGNVKVLQYVPGGYRRYRFWAHPFTGYIPLSQIENYIDVTGTGGATNGFTTTGTNAPSAFRYNPAVGNSSLISDPGWRPFTSAYAAGDTNRLNQYQGIRLFIRGAKNEGLGYGTYTPSPVTVGMWGAVNQGNQTVYLSKGSSANQDYNMVGNPYPSPVDIGTVVYNAKVSGNVVGSAFYVWNPSLGAGGQFQAIFIGTASASPYYLQSYCAFQVRAAHNGDSLNFTESNKNASSTTSLFRAQPGCVSLAVYDANYHPWDMLHISFNGEASNDEDRMFDATKPSGAYFNFYSLSGDNQKLAIDARPYVANSSIPLGISSGYAQDFIFKAENLSVPDNGKVYLHDKLLKQYVLLNQGTEYKFTINETASTQGNDRFELSMNPSEVSTVQNAKGMSFSMYPNPAAEDFTINFEASRKANASLRITDVSGVTVYSQELGAVQSGSRKIQLQHFASGIYMVELTSGSEKFIQRLVKE